MFPQPPPWGWEFCWWMWTRCLCEASLSGHRDQRRSRLHLHLLFHANEQTIALPSHNDVPLQTCYHDDFQTRRTKVQQPDLIEHTEHPILMFQWQMSSNGHGAKSRSRRQQYLLWMATWGSRAFKQDSVRFPLPTEPLCLFPGSSSGPCL